MSQPHRRPRLRGPVATLVAIAALLALPILSEAAHWPNFGGDAGHSGYQPIDQATMPTAFKTTGTDSGDIHASIITTGGADASKQFLAYGKTVVVSNASNDLANVHLRALLDGAEKIPAADQDVDDNADDPDAFGPTITPGAFTQTAPVSQGVSFVDASGHGTPGQLYVVHNDSDSDAQNDNGCNPVSADVVSDNDIAIAQFDEATGAKKADYAIGQAQGTPPDPTCAARTQASDGYTIESSPVITPVLDAQTGKREIIFIAKNDSGGAARLFAVTITNAGSASAVIASDSPQYRDIPNANTLASPTIAYLQDPSRSTVIPYVVVPIKAAAGVSDIQTFKVSNLADIGPTVPVDVPGDPQTVSVPADSDGTLPGEDGNGGSDGEKAPALFAAYNNKDGTTTVRRFFQQADNTVMTASPAATPTVLPDGFPAAALALTARVVNGTLQEGRVVVTTGRNLILLNSETLTPVDRYRDTAPPDNETLLTPGVSGFARNTALVSGNYIFVTDDEGAQFVLNLSNAERVTPSEFTENLGNNTSSKGVGQPALSHGFLQFLSDRGFFVYQTGVTVPPPPVNNPPVANFTFTPNPPSVGQPVTFDATSSSDSDGTITTYEWDLDGNGDFETNTGTTPTTSATYTKAGTVSVQLRVTDNGGKSTTTARDVPVAGAGPGGTNAAPTASFTISPNPAKTTDQVTFDAGGSTDPDGGITTYAWDLDGNGTYEVTGSASRVIKQYATPGVYNVRLRVTDTAGANAETIRQLTVSGTPTAICTTARCAATLSARVTPKRDTKAPLKFTIRGTLTPPAGVDRTKACDGRVSVQIKRGSKTLSNRRVQLSSSCTYRSSITFANRKRIGRAKNLRFIARFQGNKLLLPKSAATQLARVR